jgi:hypothetical protein
MDQIDYYLAAESARAVKYNPDEDITKSRGVMGMALADTILESYGYNIERYRFKQQLKIMKRKLMKKNPKLEEQSKNIYR